MTNKNSNNTKQLNPNKLTAKKKFGQNFLVNSGMQFKIVNVFKELLTEYNPDWILEIGVGQGDITTHLVDFLLPIVGLEIDQESINVIKNKKIKIETVLGDALELTDLDKKNFVEIINSSLSTNKESIKSQKFILFSSLPFNVGSRIIINWAINFPDIPFLVILQKEVVNKIKISKKITVFGLFLSLIFNLKHCFDIPAGNFYPAPNVTSSLLEGTAKETLPEYLSSAEKRKNVLLILKKLLHFPNKTLQNNLKNLNWDEEKISNFLISNNLSSNYRLLQDDYEKIIQQIIKAEQN